MNRYFRLPALLFPVLLAVLLAGCRAETERSAEMFVFGTIVEVKLWGVADDKADRAIADLQQMFQRMHRDWHAWEPGRLTAINEAFAQGQPAMADGDIAGMVRRSQWLERQTQGRFNPAIGGLIRLWGFHTSEYPIIGPPPAAAEIDAWLAGRPSSLDVTVDGTELRSANPAVQLDFGGIAKGYAVDLAISRLRQMGIRNAIVNAGGDLRAMGDHGDRPWRVAIRQPGGGIVGAVEVAGDESLFTSGNYERFRQHETERYPHILDPRTGWPVADVASVTVIADEGITADAAATALIVAGLKEWPKVARTLELEQVLVIDEAGTAYLTPAMARRVRFAQGVGKKIVEINAGAP